MDAPSEMRLMKEVGRFVGFRLRKGSHRDGGRSSSNNFGNFQPAVKVELFATYFLSQKMALTDIIKKSSFSWQK
jgi:hypothetical protein